MFKKPRTTPTSLDPAERVGMLSAAAKNIATLTRSSVNLKKFRPRKRHALPRLPAKSNWPSRKIGYKSCAVPMA